MTTFHHPLRAADIGADAPDSTQGHAQGLALKRGQAPASAGTVVGRARLIGQMFAIIDDGSDWDRLSEVFLPSVVYQRPGYPAMHGIDELRTFYAYTRQVAAGRHHIYRILSEGAMSCCWGMFSGTTKAEEKVAVYFTDWYRFAKGKIGYRRTFFYQPVI
jgi:limonene-1,2-epoxide hydrolase